MAFIDQEQDPNNPNGQNGQGGQGSQPQVGSGSSVVGGSSGGGNPSAGVGPGGTGGWTNIQAYLGANQGDTGSSQLLNKEVGDTFNQERQNFTNDSSKFLTDAQSQADKNKISNDDADKYINQASGMYFGKQNDDGTTSADGSDPQYKSMVDKFQHSLNDQYSGPTSYNYGFGDKTQQYGADLGDNASFDQLMKGLYSKASGSPLSGGQYELQKQFDVNNQNLVDARNNLSNQYGQLGADRDKAVTDTTAGLGNIEQGYRTSQNALHDYLTGKSNDYQTKEQQAEADAKAGYQNSFQNDPTAANSALYGVNIANDPGYDAALGVPVKAGLTAQQLQREQDLINQGRNQTNTDGVGNYYYVSHLPNSNPEWQQFANNAANNAGALGQFYNTQENKYANTGDAEKRAYNTLQDFLGGKDPRLTQGFDVGAPVSNPTFHGGFRGGR